MTEHRIRELLHDYGYEAYLYYKGDESLDQPIVSEQQLRSLEDVIVAEIMATFDITAMLTVVRNLIEDHLSAVKENVE